ncbi:MAG TPA: 2-phosphosulfolactate phosphatase [Pirellulales bacterium]|nr:2-phosphosulfolactate phosphatase [Pirellulales bacterium]
MTSLKAHFLPALTTPEALVGTAVVVIDVLRATTVIPHALAAGAQAVIPCLEVEDALQAAAGLPAGQAVLGGERLGLKIEGFDLGNSPDEYTQQAVGGKTLVFTTTNGTRAMMHCRQAQRALMGSFVNASAIIEALAAERDVRLLCAGTRGEVTREDVLFAGFVADSLLRRLGDGAAAAEINDQLLIARDCWQAFLAADPGADRVASLASTLRSTQGGRNLQRIGLEHDIDVAARIDRFAILPRLELSEWKIVM